MRNRLQVSLILVCSIILGACSSSSSSPGGDGPTISGDGTVTSGDGSTQNTDGIKVLKDGEIPPPDGWLERLGKNVGFSAGSFNMGSPTTEGCRDETDEFQHPVSLTHDFEIANTEVTQKEFE